MTEDALLELLATLGAVVFGIVFYFVDIAMHAEMPRAALPDATALPRTYRVRRNKRRIDAIRLWQLYGTALVSLVISSCVVALLAGLIYLVPYMFR